MCSIYFSYIIYILSILPFTDIQISRFPIEYTLSEGIFQIYKFTGENIPNGVFFATLNFTLDAQLEILRKLKNVVWFSICACSYHYLTPSTQRKQLHSGLSLSPQMEGSSESKDWQPKSVSTHVKVSSGQICTDSQSWPGRSW